VKYKLKSLITRNLIKRPCAKYNLVNNVIALVRSSDSKSTLDGDDYDDKIIVFRLTTNELQRPGLVLIVGQAPEISCKI
jgi:hypothetical protein